LLLNQGTAWFFLALAKRALMRSQLEQAQPKTSEPVPELAQSATAPSVSRNSKQAQLRDSAPIQWLLARRSPVPWVLWLFPAGAALIIARYGADAFGRGLGRFGFVALALAHIVLKIGIATDAVHCLSTDRRSGALESLLGTEVSLQEMTSAIARIFRRRMGGPVLLLTVGTLLAAVRMWLGRSNESALLLAVAGLILPLEAYALFWIGLFQGLAARNAAVALATAVFEIVLLPWAWFVMARSVFWSSSALELSLLWIVFSIVNHGWFLSHAKTHLFRHFRTLALKPYGGKNPLMESQWSAINWDEEGEEAGCNVGKR
jgi:hypothetical protein